MGSGRKDIPREVQSKGGKASSRKGIPHKRSTEAAEKMEKRGFDPLHLSMDLALGISTNYVHPYARVLEKHLADFINGILDDENIPEESAKVMIKKLNNLSKKSVEEMSKNYVPQEVRAKIITDLLRYRYPKLKDIEISGGMDVNIPQLELICKNQ